MMLLDPVKSNKLLKLNAFVSIVSQKHNLTIAMLLKVVQFFCHLVGALY